MLYHLLLQTVNTLQSPGVSPGQPHLLLYEVDDDTDLNKAVNDLSQAARGGPLYVIADEAVSKYSGSNEISYIQTFCDKLFTQVPRLHFWASSCYHEDTPVGWQVVHLTRPLRSPPTVVREVKKDVKITKHGYVKPYSERGVPDHTDGPPVRRLYHRGQGHSGRWPGDCVRCGGKVARVLQRLRVDVTENITPTSTAVTSTSDCTTPPCLQWRDVFVLYWYEGSENTGMVNKLQEAGIPVRVMKDDDIEDVATARSDVVWVAGGHRVRGLERKVVVCLGDPAFDSFRSERERHTPELRQYNPGSARLDLMSRCTSQLVIISAHH
ncbi:uncharacterized protein LOC112574822 [Pomacea canaliculata]|uniref:uncharacterized protein LOC112574822 n=1 Tax=Pomacea canaliculata TaxID=400727 RepID=UPI000D727C84|nr:uncharacterized protein LOC112574822 [Pomacea canaliculata]